MNHINTFQLGNHYSYVSITEITMYSKRGHGDHKRGEHLHLYQFMDTKKGSCFTPELHLLVFTFDVVYEMMEV